VGENVGKFDPNGPSYVQKLLWGGSSIWSYALAFLTNPGLLTFPVIGLFFVAYQRRYKMSNAEKLLWIWIAALFVSFALPSQRSGRYLLAAMPAVALLCALNWSRISRKLFIASLLLMAIFITSLAYLAFRLQAELTSLYSPLFWLLLLCTGGVVLGAIVVPSFSRNSTSLGAILVLLCLAAFLHPFNGKLGNFSAAAQKIATGKEVWVPCNFRAMYEGHRFILPSAEIYGYNEDQGLVASELAERYPLFVLRLPMNSQAKNGDCAECTIIGERLDIRGRQNSTELKEIFLKGHVFKYLFVREVLISSPVASQSVPSPTAAQMCH